MIIKKNISTALFTFTLIASSFSTQAHEYLILEEFFNGGGGADLNAIELRTEEVAPGLYVLFASGGNAGNILVSIGDQGTLIIDSMYAPVVPKIQQAVADLGGGDIDFLINTHFHFDHADGNPLLARSGTNIVAHANARRSMVAERPIDMVNIAFLQPPYPKDTLPVITFDDHMQFHFNDETIDLHHIAPAHTSGDAIIYLRNSNIIHMGDVFNNDGYPFVDTDNGGDIDGMIEFCKSALRTINEETIVLPGHGEMLTYDDLENHITMLETVRNRIGRLIDGGNSLEEVLAARPTSDFDDKYGLPTLAGDPTIFINRIYKSLTQ
ncbi:MAG: MBL fold metallo-hydrolase [Gammaproteobacteria bacterium]|nr:MBL fold metallo-hydrolase [Gammaproteobacteria bacterium]